MLREEGGEGEALLFARSATAGGQQYPVHWGGDCEPRFNAMAESLCGGLSLGLSGFGFRSHDIGGFEGTPTPTVFKGWVQFGLLSSHSRLHGSKSYRVPWDYGEEAVAVTREFTLLKHRLAPRLHSRLPAPTGPLPRLSGPTARRRMRAARLRSRSPRILPLHAPRGSDMAAERGVVACTA